MSSPLVNQAAAIGAPVAAADSTGLTGVNRYATATSNASAAVPEQMRGKIIYLSSSSVDTQFAFGTATSGPTLVYNQAAALGTGHASAGRTVFAGSTIEVKIPHNATRMAWISSNTGGFFEFGVNEDRQFGRKGIA